MEDALQLGLELLAGLLQMVNLLGMGLNTEIWNGYTRVLTWHAIYVI
jgi:hypothetical protein